MKNLVPSKVQHTTIITGAALTGLLVGVLAGCAPSGPSNAATSETPAQSAPAQSAAPQPAAGTHMITNQGHQLAFHVIPGRLPAIVLDAGGGLDSSSWKDIAPELAESTGAEVITYDREGMGASDAVPGPWKVQNAVSDLEAGLDTLGATEVVLVSHSEAGEIATSFARQHPEQLRGAVLVDASLPQFYTDSEIARVAAASSAQVAALKGHATTKADKQLVAVAADYVPAHKAYHQISWPSSVPAIVIASAQTPFPTSPTDARAWRAAQAEFAKGATNRHLVTAAHSSHDVPQDAPELVEAQVEALLGTVG